MKIFIKAICCLAFLAAYSLSSFAQNAVGFEPELYFVVSPKKFSAKCNNPICTYDFKEDGTFEMVMIMDCPNEEPMTFRQRGTWKKADNKILFEATYPKAEKYEFEIKGNFLVPPVPKESIEKGTTIEDYYYRKAPDLYKNPKGEK